jgi:peptide/nickel transport system permease protein
VATVNADDRLELVTSRPERPPRAVGLVASADWKLVTGIAIMAAMILFGTVGRLVVDADGMRLGAAPFSRPPTREHIFGTDSAGRDLFTIVVYSMLPTLVIGLVAGGVGTALGAILGLITGYFHGPADTVIRTVADVLLAIPTLLVMVVVASFITTGVTTMSLIIALFSWPWAARTVRAQTLSLRERPFVDMAKLTDSNSWEIIFRELLPNLLPFIMASFVGAVSGGILAAVGLQLLGLGPIETPTLGLLLNNAFQYAALYRGMWWWWLPPTVLLGLLFIGLFLVSLALDEIANPRLRKIQG